MPHVLPKTPRAGQGADKSNRLKRRRAQASGLSRYSLVWHGEFESPPHRAWAVSPVLCWANYGRACVFERGAATQAEPARRLRASFFSARSDFAKTVRGCELRGRRGSIPAGASDARVERQGQVCRAGLSSERASSPTI